VARQALSREAVTESERLTATELESNLAIPRDDIALAMAYKGLTAVPNATAALVTTPLKIGTRQQINILNTDLNIVNNVTMELLDVSDHAYFWFDATNRLEWPSLELLTLTAVAFDQIYEQN
jgi:hypothetical protein